ncbi:MAG TPA: methyltransferase domain-containing protein [Acidimicrobiia bacterium]
MTGETNPSERRRWNDERWTSVWPKRERFTDAVTPRLLDALALTPGERVLDVGCGGGKATIEAGRRVGSQGSAIGADISVPLVELATRRAREAAADNVTFQVVDMQHDSVPGRPFDVAMSQFGVMFFDEPVTAFVNIARHLRVDGRIVFACWESVDRNPWFVASALARFLPPVPPPGEGKSPTGPFALADHERTAGILRDAGFSAIRRTAIDFTVDLPEDAIVDDDQLEFMGVSEADMPAARRAIDDHMGRFRQGPEISRFPLSFQIFEAQNFEDRRAGS